MCWEMTKCICATIKVGLGRTELSCGVRVLKEVEVGRKTFMRKLGNIQYIFWFSIIYSLAEGGEKGREGWVLARTSWQLIIRFKLKYLWKGTCRGVASFRTVNCKILLLTYCVPVPKCNEWFISFPLLKKKKKQINRVSHLWKAANIKLCQENFLDPHRMETREHIMRQIHPTWMTLRTAASWAWVSIRASQKQHGHYGRGKKAN